jgi:hypothetical protein
MIEPRLSMSACTGHRCDRECWRKLWHRPESLVPSMSPPVETDRCRYYIPMIEEDD